MSSIYVQLGVDASTPKIKFIKILTYLVPGGLPVCLYAWMRRRRVSKVFFQRSMRRTRGGHVRLYYECEWILVV
jgi:hypothetical protein